MIANTQNMLGNFYPRIDPNNFKGRLLNYYQLLSCTSQTNFQHPDKPIPRPEKPINPPKEPPAIPKPEQPTIVPDEPISIPPSEKPRQPPPEVPIKPETDEGLNFIIEQYEIAMHQTCTNTNEDNMAIL